MNYSNFDLEDCVELLNVYGDVLQSKPLNGKLVSQLHQLNETLFEVIYDSESKQLFDVRIIASQEDWGKDHSEVTSTLLN